MNISAPFIARPVATMLLAIGLFLAGCVAFRFLPISALPRVDIPTIVVFAGRPGASPETMAASIAAPLERRLGEIAGVTEITSSSSIGSASIVVQFDISRDISGAAFDVQAAINAATQDLPSDLPVRPYYRKFNPADAPIMSIALSSDTLSTAQIYDGLLAFKTGTGDVEPALAESYSANAELTEWTFKLRPGVKFHNGATFEADDVLATFGAMWDVKNPAHKGRTGNFEYWTAYFGTFLNAPAK